MKTTSPSRRPLRAHATRRSTRMLALLVSVAGGALSLTACSEEGASSADDVDLIESFGSTVVIKDNCLATKVGPNHLLFAAHCVELSPKKFAPGARIQIGNARVKPYDFQYAEDGGYSGDGGGHFNGGHASDGGYASDGGGYSDGGYASDGGGYFDGGGYSDGGYASDGGGYSDGGYASDGGADASSGFMGWRTVTVDRIEIEPRRAALCPPSATCVNMFDRRGPDAPDVVVVLTKEPLDFVPTTAKVDLDRVVPEDELVLVGGACSNYLWQPEVYYSHQRVMSAETRALSPYAAFHPGSHLNHLSDRATVAAEYAGSYFASPGAEWETGEFSVCPGRSGGPVYRADARNVIVGVNATSTFEGRTSSPALPMTNGHTRLDDASRWRVGAWLESLGVETVRSCSTRACVPFDGGALPDLDAGAEDDGSAPPADPDGGPTTDGGSAPDGG